MADGGMTGKYTWEEYQNMHKALAEIRFMEVEKECARWHDSK